MKKRLDGWFPFRAVSAVVTQLVKERARRPHETASTVLSLAVVLGLGASASVIVDSLYLKPLPFRDIGSLWMVGRSAPPSSSSNRLRLGDLEALRGQQSVETTAGFIETYGLFPRRFSKAEGLADTAITPGFFETFRAQMQEGTAQLPAYVRGQVPHVVISDRLWSRRFLRDRAVVGQSVLLGGRPAIISGVAAVGFDFPNRTNVWLGLDSTVASSRLVVTGVARTVNRPATWPPEHYSAMSLNDFLRSGPKSSDAIVGVAMVAVVLCTLLHICSSQVHEGLAAERALSLRLALGATRGDLILRVLLSAFITSSAAASLGAILCKVIVGGLGQMSADLSLGAPNFVFDWRAVVTLLVLTCASASFLSLASLSIVANAQPAKLLHGWRGSDGATGRVSVEKVALIGQVCGMTAAIFFGLTSMFSYANTIEKKIGFEFDGLSWVVFPGDATDGNRRAAAERVLQGLRHVPDVVNASWGPVPFSSSRTPVSVALEPATSLADYSAVPEIATEHLVWFEYFESLRIQIRHGRSFRRDLDIPDSVVVLSHGVALTLGSGADIVGRDVYVSGRKKRVIGVSDDVRSGGPESPITQIVYSLDERPDAIVVRSLLPSAQAISLTVSLLQAETRLDGPMISSDGLTEYSRSSAGQRGRFNLLGAVALACIAIVVVSVHAHTTRMIRRKEHEIAIRLALGAPNKSLARSLIQKQFWPTLSGAVLGGLLGVSVVRATASLWDGVSTGSWVLPILAGTLTIFVATAAALLATIKILGRRRTSIISRAP